MRQTRDPNQNPDQFLISSLRAEMANLKLANSDLGYTCRRIARERDAAVRALEEARSLSAARLVDDVGGARAMIADSHAALAPALRVAQ